MQPDDVIPQYTRHRDKLRAMPPTRHLHLLFVGPDDAAMRAFVEPHGAVECVRGSHAEECFASFASVDNAVAAKAALEGHVVATSVARKPVVVRFADRSDDARVARNRPAPVRTLLRAADMPPAGLLLVNDFITEAEEAQLLADLDARPWEHGIKRRVQHYGFEFDYTTRSVNPSFGAVRPIPPSLVALFERMRNAGLPHTPDQITVNEYVPGVGIKYHVDTHAAFDDGIASLSLGSPIAFDMRSGERRFSVGLLPRSFLVICGESRYGWEHGIAARQTDEIDGRTIERGRRVSVTFRRVRPAGAQCRCAWPMCESQSDTPLPAMDAVETEGVVQFYNRIAEHFVRTRHTPWPRAADFASAMTPGQTLLDVGCGNGRHMIPARDVGAVAFGCDLIEKFVNVCNQRRLEVLSCDALCMPYRSHVFDKVMCIAVLHHLASVERRLRALQELTRVTALKGLVLVTVWAFEQDEDSKRVFDTQDVMVPWVLPAEFDPLRPEASKPGAKREPPSSVDRYCHVFKKGELDELIGRMPNVTIVESYYDASNWACIYKKIAL